MNYHPAIRWVVALKPEAQPIINTLGLSLCKKDSEYPTYMDRSGEHWLVISGIGKTNTANAVVYLNKQSTAPPWAAWINVGIAGSGLGNYGEIYMVDRISCEMSSNSLYPGVAVSTEIPRFSLLTVNQPKTDYHEQELIDMEGYSFYEAANKFSCRELVAILKIVSDGPNSSVRELTRKKISALISNNVGKILKIASSLSELSAFEAQRLTIPDECHEVMKKWHFTVSQKHQLIYLVHRWKTAFSGTSLIDTLGHCKNARSVIKYLSREIDAIEIDWGQI